jgi:hypothetical protein
MLTQAQKFVYLLAGLSLGNIVVLILFNVYALNIFFILLYVEFFVLIEFTAPQHFKARWRNNLIFFILAGILIFSLFVYQQVLLALQSYGF